jgi:hypothetical protein
MNEICSICLDPISDKSVKVSCCNKIINCYIDAMKVKRICPLCRTVFQSEVVVIEPTNNLIVPTRSTITVFGASLRIASILIVLGILGGICYAMGASAFG